MRFSVPAENTALFPDSNTAAISPDEAAAGARRRRQRRGTVGHSRPELDSRARAPLIALPFQPFQLILPILPHPTYPTHATHATFLQASLQIRLGGYVTERAPRLAGEDPFEDLLRFRAIAVHEIPVPHPIALRRHLHIVRGIEVQHRFG